MEHSWNYRPPPPPIQGNICPTCSISHFPFCPSPLPFNQNPSFLSPNPPPFQRPLFDPFLGPLPPAVNFHRPFPDDRFVDPRPWHRNPSFEEPSMVNGGYNGDGFALPRYDHGGAGFKRMRVDEMGRGSFASDNPMNSPRNFMDNERRLKLIRDHGGLDSDREAQGYLRENTVFDRGFGGVDSVESGRFDESRGGRNSIMLKSPSNYEMNGFRDPRFGDFDRKGAYFDADLDFSPHKYGGKQENSRVYRNNEQLGQSQYGQANGHTRLGSDAETLHYEGGKRRYSNLGDNYSQSLSIENHDSNHYLSQPHSMQNPTQQNHDTLSHGQLNDRSGNQYFHNQDGYASLALDSMNPMQASRIFHVQPPLPTSPPPPLPVDPPGHPLSGPCALSSPATTSSSLFPIAVSSAATVPSSYASVAEANSLARPYFHDRSRLHASTGFATEVWLTHSWLAFILRHPS